MPTFINKVPILPLLIAVVGGLFLANGSYVLGGGAGLLLGFFSYYISKWESGGCLLLGVAVFLNHADDIQRLNAASGILGDYALTTLPLSASEAVVERVVRAGDRQRVRLRILSDDAHLRGAGREIPAGVRLVASGEMDLVPGAVISFTGMIQSSVSYGNFGEIDWQGFRERKGIAGSIYLSEVEVMRVNKWRAWGYHKRLALKGFFLQKLRVGISESSPSYSMIPAILFGEQPVDKSWIEPYRDAGVMHMFVVSGLHVGMVMVGVYVLLYFLPTNTRVTLFLALIILWVYAWMTGMNPPVVRSSLALSIFISALILKRRMSAQNSVLVALLLVLLGDHFSLYNVGVWLSFGVVYGLITGVLYLLWRTRDLYTPHVYLPTLLWSSLQQFTFNKGKWLLGVVYTSIIAWFISSLITGYKFGKVYVLGIISGWLILPAVFSMMFLSGVVMLLSPFMTDSLAPLNRVNDRLAGYVTSVVERVNEVPWAVWYVKSAGYSEGVTVFNLPKGHGCLYVQGLLIDAGGERTAAYYVKPLLEQAGCDVETIFLTHDDMGHKGGVVHFPEAEVLAPSPSSTEIVTTGEWMIQSIALGVTGTSRADDQVSLVKISKGDYVIGYISDAGAETFKALKESQQDFSCDVLITGSHGYGEDAVSDFLSYSGAETVILGSTYFHEGKRMVKGAETFDQRYCGAVRVQVTESGLSIISHSD